MSDAQRLLDLAARVEALLPCPFCGSPASEGCGGPKQHWISCDGCSVEGPIEQEMFQAVAAWNTRTPDATHLREVNAALVEALREIEAKARDLADDAMTNQRGLWLACANEARAALARATTQEQSP
ncbi:hypothetical protein RADP37_05405 (plasmid) [Roseomonas mucosa]|uniref:Restriction alleviation protein, Lar family n=1 Tax=Roseomonas mucosa TaxID=207340 RepID=A0A4Y1MQY8_9PROT|nr:Lar family restriction alleviation protein [Roseomonas mucosa]AWV20328.1 hypothetical protein RADP37_05405 [Roseomonas mucosa]